MKISIFFNNQPPLNRNIPLENFPLYVILTMYEYIFIARGRISPFTATVKNATSRKDTASIKRRLEYIGREGEVCKLVAS